MKWRLACATALTGAFVAGSALAQTGAGTTPTPTLPGTKPPGAQPGSQPGTLPGSPPPPPMPQPGIPSPPQSRTDTLGNPQSPTGPGPMAPCPLRHREPTVHSGYWLVADGEQSAGASQYSASRAEVSVTT